MPQYYNREHCMRMVAVERGRRAGYIRYNSVWNSGGAKQPRVAIIEKYTIMYIVAETDNKAIWVGGMIWLWESVKCLGDTAMQLQENITNNRTFEKNKHSIVVHCVKEEH